MSDSSGRYWLSYNGEVYNFRKIRTNLESNGTRFSTGSDTEVLLHLLIKEGKQALQRLNGFFAFCFIDTSTGYSLIARDRLGIKPLYYQHDRARFRFASELKALLQYPILRDLDGTALNLYFQLNYIPAPLTIIKDVRKLEPGHLIEIENGKVRTEAYYGIPWSGKYVGESYSEAQVELRSTLQQAVNARMVSDVPLGCFLSGGTDSSIISMLAKRGTDKLKTFSLGYADNPFFDETEYAESVASHIGSDHTTFRVSDQMILDQVPSVLSILDEPFADSSALAVNILSQRTREYVTVALSGDGADELFSGYNKHAAEWMLRTNRLKSSLLRTGKPLWSALPHSRGSYLSDLFRKLDRFAEGSALSPADRYWRWACILSSEQASTLLNPEYRGRPDSTIHQYTKYITGEEDLNDTLYSDCRLVLPNDMLTKVDRMSMAHGLEVRTPFLDHNLVEFAFSIPSEYKITRKVRKRILQDAYRSSLPEKLYNRGKHGFEIPLRSWMTGIFADQINERYLSIGNTRMQRIISKEATLALKARLFSKDPGDAHATIWAIMVLDHWLEDLSI